MKKIIKIARAELNTLFYSPVAWLILVIFIVQSGIGFLGQLEGLSRGLSRGMGLSQFTSMIFIGRGYFFDNVLSNLYLYLPLLTMGLMSRETSSGSIKLLLSSPVTITEIIFGKYLAMLWYGLLLILVLVIYCSIAAFYIPAMDTGLVLSGLLGIYILIATYSAIGLFMSSLTSYQVIAALSTIVVFAALRFIGTFGQDIDFVRDITYFLSVSGRTNMFINGLITSKDLAYFLIIIVLFLYLTILHLEARRETGTWISVAGKYVLLIGGALLLGYISSRPRWTLYADVTANKRHTISDSSLSWIKKLDGPVTITTYANIFDQDIYMVLPVSRNFDLQSMATFQRYIPDLTINYVYYYDSTSADGVARSVVARAKELDKMPAAKGGKPLPAKGTGIVQPGDGASPSSYVYTPPPPITDLDDAAIKVADNMNIDENLFIKPTEVRKLADLSPEDNQIVRVIEYKGRKTFLRFYYGMNKYPGEEEIIAAVKRLLDSVPQAVFITGDNERSAVNKGDRNYFSVAGGRHYRNALINQGFDVVNIDLAKDSVPESTSILILADPAAPLDTIKQQKIRRYIDRGGNMLITGEPGRQQYVNPVLALLGIRLKEGMIVKNTPDLTPDFINGVFYREAGALKEQLASRIRFNRVAMPNTAAIEAVDSGFKITPLVISPEGSWLSPRPVDITVPYLAFDSLAGDIKDRFSLAATLQREVNGKQQRILVSGDADFMSNIVMERNDNADNSALINAMFRWFTGGAFPVIVDRKAPKDTVFTLQKNDVFPLRIIFLGILPGLLVLGGAFFLIRRARN